MEFVPWRVDYELAVKLKEAGYPQTDDYAYFNEGTWGRLYCVNRAISPQYPREVDLYTFGFDGKTDPLKRIAENSTGIAAPTFEQVQDWLDDMGLNIFVVPLYHTTGIKWTWSIKFYLPKEEWKDHDIETGIGPFGEEAFLTTRFNAMLQGIQKALTLLNKPREII